MGAAVGAVAARLYHDYARQADGTELFPLVLDNSLFAQTIVLATLTGLAAAIVPALRAARLDPVVAIRG
jgi:lipoprotein-releasing system permease protein